MNKLMSLIFLVLMFACGGSSSSQNTGSTSVPKTYGVFRTLKSTSSKPLASVVKDAATSVATSSTMSIPRAYHRSIQMLNGKILIVGGDLINDQIPSGGYTVSGFIVKGTMDIFDPSTETFTPSNAQLSHVRAYQYMNGTVYESFALVNLPDGKVAIIGNRCSGVSGPTPNDAYEVYDSTTDTVESRTLLDWTGKPGITLEAVDAAYYIGKGQIIIFASNSGQYILDTSTNILTTMANPIYEGFGAVGGASSIQTPNGDVYLIGGTFNNTVTTSIIGRYSISDGSWAIVGHLNTPRDGANLVLLPGNRIGIYGGRNFSSFWNYTPLTSVEIFNCSTNTLVTSVDLVGPRFGATVSYLQTGYTMIAGGTSAKISGGGMPSPQTSQLVHNADLNYSGSTGDMVVARVNASSVALSNGLVLITGGTGVDNSMSNTGEIFDPKAALYMGYQSETIVMGTTMQFSAKDSSGNSVTPTWTVDDQTIATIDSNGVLTPVAPGIVTVTATSGANTAVARITVIPAQ